DGPYEGPHGGHTFDALRDRAPLHDPASPRRLRRRARAGQVRVHGRAQPRRVLQGVPVPRRRRAARAGGEPRRSGRVALQPALVTALRTAGPADARAVTALINAAYEVERFFVDGDRTSEAEVRQYMAKGTFLVADQDGAPIGCVYTEQRGDRGYFGLLAVDPGQHGKGVGRTLIAAAEDASGARGAAPW